MWLILIIYLHKGLGSCCRWKELMATMRCIYYCQNPAFAIAPHVNPNHHPKKCKKFYSMSFSEYEPESDCNECAENASE